MMAIQVVILNHIKYATKVPQISRRLIKMNSPEIQSLFRVIINTETEVGNLNGTTLI